MDEELTKRLASAAEILRGHGWPTMAEWVGRARAEIERLRATDLMRSNVMGRIAIVLFDERNNVTDEQCVERLALVKKVSTALYAACRAFAEWANANPLLNDQREGSEFSAVYNAAFDALELAAALAAAPEGRPQ